MTGSRSLLVELLVEELPPKALKRLGEAFAGGLYDGLKARKLTSDKSAVTPYATPRRLAVHISSVRSLAADEERTEKLMAVSVGIGADGRPTTALVKRLEKVGRAHLASLWPNAVDGPDRVLVQTDGKADALYLRTLEKGVSLVSGLQSALDDALDRLPIPKVMSYQLADGWSSVRFVRPAHGLVALHGDEVVPVTALGLEAGSSTQGHRFEALLEPVQLQDADHYARVLDEQGAVIANFERRRAEIVRQLDHAAAAEGLRPIDDPALLDEVTALVEWPNVLLGRFDESFLAVPPECLILTMKANQKYFPLLDAAGRLTNRFLVVANIRPADPSRVVQGNERVVRPRLADAKFFFDQDRRRRLEERVPALDKVVYHAKLGTMGDRVSRLRQIARWAAERIDGADPDLSDRAAMLAKADLLTDMVGEFPELQGIMGGCYARLDGEAENVWRAIEGQYAVRRDGAAEGTNLDGEALLLADRSETLVGIWSTGVKPSGDKDPFALRRNALGIISSFDLLGAAARRAGRTMRLTLRGLLDKAAGTFPGRLQAASVVEEVEQFVYERYANQLAPGFGPQKVDAVISQRPPLQQVVQRVRAVVEFAKLAEAEALAAANKRVGNILKKADVVVDACVDASLLREPAEAALHESLQSVAPRAAAAFEAGDYAASLRELAALKAPVDRFFDDVMVNTDDAVLRANRLGLLATLHASMNRVADLSKLAA